MLEEQVKKRVVLEERLWADGKKYVVGVDEVGRGPVAGPVMVAAVILPVGCMIEGVRDSKKLTAKRREQLKPIIEEAALAWSIKEKSPQVIDEINILQATLLAMKEAVEELGRQHPIDLVLVDGNSQIPGLAYKQATVIDGEDQSISIASASILAKVTRDALMNELCAQEECKYLWCKNKGYLTREHQERILQYGLSDHHRRTFLKKLLSAS